MAGDEPNLEVRGKNVYTYSEALAHMKEENKRPTDIRRGPTQWRDIRTGAKVYINVSGL